MASTTKVFQKHLINYMKEHNLNMNDLASILDVTPITISRWLKGNGIANTSVIKLCKQLGINKRELFGEQRNPVTPIDRHIVPVQVEVGSGYPKRPRPLAWVSEYAGFSKQSIYRLLEEPEAGCAPFPRPIKLGARKVAWLESEVLAWVDSRIQASRA